MCGLTLGFFAVVFCFVGMECTYIGGAEKAKDKLLLAGAVFHFAGGEYGTFLFFVNDRNVLPSLSLGIHETSAHRGDRYRWLLLIHQQGSQDILCSKYSARSFEVLFFHHIFLLHGTAH